MHPAPGRKRMALTGGGGPADGAQDPVEQPDGGHGEEAMLLLRRSNVVESRMNKERRTWRRRRIDAGQREGATWPRSRVATLSAASMHVSSSAPSHPARATRHIHTPFSWRIHGRRVVLDAAPLPRTSQKLSGGTTAWYAPPRDRDEE